MYIFCHSANVFSCGFFFNILSCTPGCISHCITIHAGALNWSVILMRPVLYFRIPPTVGVQEAKSATVGSQTQNVATVCQFYSTSTVRRKLHWTQARIPTCCHTVDAYRYCNSNSTPPNSHECDDDQCEWNVFVWFLCELSAFWLYVGQKCYCKILHYNNNNKNPKNCILLVEWYSQ